MIIPRLLPLLAVLFPLMVSGAEKTDPAELKKQLVRSFPELSNAAVRAAPVTGLVAFEFDGQVVYATPDGKYLVLGDIVEVATRTNLTENERGRQIIRLIDEIGEANMIVIGPANAKRVMTVFTDVDCPYCLRLHQDVPELNRQGVRVRYLLYPRAGIGSETYRKSVSAWCAEDRVKAIGIAKGGGRLEAKNCANPVERHYRLGERIGVTGTPTIYLDNGRKIGGYVPAAKMLPLLGLASAPAATP
jgi:thiol:disulfide interchange protein DsbC